MSTITTNVVAERFRLLRQLSMTTSLAELSDEELQLFDLESRYPEHFVSRLTSLFEFLTPTDELEAAYAALGITHDGATLRERREQLLEEHCGMRWDVDDMQRLEIQEIRGLYAIAMAYDIVMRLSGLIDTVKSVAQSVPPTLGVYERRRLNEAIRLADPRASARG